MRSLLGHGRIARVGVAVTRMMKHLDRVNTFGLAAEMAFWVFLSLVPLAAVAGLVLAKLAMSHWGNVSTSLSGLPPVVSDFITKQLSSVAAWNGGAVALPAMLVFVWLASSGVHAIFDALAIQTSTQRAWWKKRALAIVTCVALSIGVAILAAVSAGISWASRAAGASVPILATLEGSIVGKIARFAIGLLVDFGLMAGLYRVGIPHGPAEPKTPIVPGAALAMVLQAILGWGYGLYVATLGKGNAYSGALWAIGVTMTALYLVAITILLGAELNRYLAARAACAPRVPGSRLHREPGARDRSWVDAIPHAAHPVHRAR